MDASGTTSKCWNCTCPRGCGCDGSHRTPEWSCCVRDIGCLAVELRGTFFIFGMICLSQGCLEQSGSQRTQKVLHRAPGFRGLDPVVESDAATTLALMASGSIQAAKKAGGHFTWLLLATVFFLLNHVETFLHPKFRINHSWSFRQRLADCRLCHHRVCPQRSAAERNLICQKLKETKNTEPLPSLPPGWVRPFRSFPAKASTLSENWRCTRVVCSAWEVFRAKLRRACYYVVCD